MKVTSKLYTIVLSTFLMTLVGCQAGVEYEDVPEDVYMNVSLTDALCDVKARGMFELYGVNWKDWKQEVLEKEITKYKTSTSSYTNRTSSSVTILGKSVAPGATIDLRNTMVEEVENTAPDGKLYVLNVFVDSKVIYKTKNNGWVFDTSKIDAAAKLVKDDKGTDVAVGTTQSEYAQYPVNPKQLVVNMNLSNTYACTVNPQDGAPELGHPADFSQPHKYLVVNTARRPDGAPEAKRLYEIRVIVLP